MTTTRLFSSLMVRLLLDEIPSCRRRAAPKTSRSLRAAPEAMSVRTSGSDVQPDMMRTLSGPRLPESAAALGRCRQCPDRLRARWESEFPARPCADGAWLLSPAAA